MRLRHALVLVGLLALGIFLYVARYEVAEAFRLILDLRWELLLLVIPLQILNFFLRALFYRSAFGHFGFRIPLKRLFSLSWAVMFANQALPSAGISAASVVSISVRRDRIPAGTASMVQVAKYGITYMSYLFLLLFGVLALYLGGVASPVTNWFAGFIAVMIITLSAFGWYVLRNRRGFNWLVRKVQRSIDWVGKRFRGGRELIGHEQVERLLGDFHAGFQQILQEKLYMKMPLVWMLLANAVGLSALYVVFLAIGFTVNPGVVVIAYALAAGSGFLSIIPGDIGVYDTVMVAVLTAVGVPLSVGVSATLLYRVVAQFSLLPIGFIFYARHMEEV